MEGAVDWLVRGITASTSMSVEQRGVSGREGRVRVRWTYSILTLFILLTQHILYFNMFYVCL